MLIWETSAFWAVFLHMSVIALLHFEAKNMSVFSREYLEKNVNTRPSTMKYTLYNPFEHRSKVFLLVASGSNRVRSAEPSACNRMCPCMCFKRVSMGARVGSKSVLLNAVSVPAWRIIAGETCQSFCQAGRTRPFSMQCLQVCVRAQQLQERSQWRAYFYEFLVLIIQVLFQQILQVQSVQGCTASLFLIFMLSSF